MYPFKINNTILAGNNIECLPLPVVPITQDVLENYFITFSPITQPFDETIPHTTQESKRISSQLPNQEPLPVRKSTRNRRQPT